MAKAPNFNNRESFEAWLNSFDDETALAYAQVLYGRAALRVMPLLAGVWDLELYTTIELDVTHSMRANFLSAVARKYSTASNREAARSAGYLAISHRFTVYSAYSAFAAGSSNFAIFSNLSTAGATAFPSSATAFETYVADMWRSVINDAKLLLSEMSVRDLDTAPIWLNGDPPWFRKSRINFDNYLREDGPHWDFWLDWYAAKVAGEPMDRLGIQGEDFIGQNLAEQDDAFWERGPKAVSADIEAWIEEWEGNRETSEVFNAEEMLEQGSGPIFAAVDGKLAALPQLPSSEEQHSVEQQKLFTRLKKLLERFKSRIGNALAQHPELCDAFDDFDDVFVVADLSQIDVYDLWMMGAGLIEQLRPFAKFDPEKSLTEPLEPGTQGSLAEIVRLHGAFVMGFEVGRSLAERSSVPLLSIEEFRALLDHERIIIRWLLENDQFELTDDARKLFEQLDSVLAKTNVGVDDLAVKAFPAIRNLLILAVRSLEKAENTAGRVSLWTGLPVHAYVIGTAAFLSENFGPIFAIAQNTPELRAYIEYHLNRLEIEFTEDEIRSKIIDH